MNVRLQRRVSFEVRRDAAVSMTNGRVVYDALFSRTGYQRYPKVGGGVSIEYRPDSEVFAGPSLLSLALLPGALLHPSKNFGTEFGLGSYPVRGTSGDPIVPHEDKIHTYGKLMVWDDQWNAEIESGETSELSLGYTITPGPPGTGPDGTAYDVMHTDIVGDHVAGVPAGNAGTARVITDAIPDPAAIRATRRALADIAAARLDARPMYFDLGRWPGREAKPQDQRRTDTTMDRNALAKALFDRLDALGPNPNPKDVRDAIVEIWGHADDPAIRAAAGAMATAPSGAYVQASVSQPSVAVEVEVGMQDAKAKLDARAKELDLERAKLDADRKAMADAQADRDDAVTLARAAIGLDWTTRTDAGPKTTEAIKLEIVGKLDAAKLKKLDAYTDPVKRAIALDLAVEDCREKLDASREKGGGLLRLIQQTHGDNAADHAEVDAKLDAELKALAERVDAAHGKTTPATA